MMGKRYTTNDNILSNNRKVIDVVDDQNANPANFHVSGLGQPLSQNAIVDITLIRNDGRNLAKAIEDFWLAHIACMDHQFGALERFDSFGTWQPVRIGNDANDVGLVHQLRRRATRASGGQTGWWRQSVVEVVAAPSMTRSLKCQ
jgi:hypothetical protein